MNVTIDTKSGTVSGTSTSSYVEALRVDTRGCGVQGKFLALIKNLDLSATLYYKINVYPSDTSGTTGLYAEAKAETSIAGNTQISSTEVDKGYAAVVILVKQNSGPGAYQIDWTTY